MVLSIAFITHNRKAELLNAINSCLLYAPYDTEYIILDNASDDGCEEYIKTALAGKINLIYEYSETNLGVAGGRNKAFELSHGDYVFFLDDDAEIETEDFFNKIINKMNEKPDVAAAAVDIKEPETGKSLNSKHRFSVNGDTYVLSFCGCAHILRGGFYRKFKRLYPQNLKFGSEEFYASALAWMNGKTVEEFSDLTVNHFPSVINRCAGDDRKLNFIVNQYIIKKMTYPIFVLPLSKLAFELHKLKHGFTTGEWKKISRTYLKERYRRDEVCRMSLRIWLRLIKMFGIKIII